MSIVTMHPNFIAGRAWKRIRGVAAGMYVLDAGWLRPRVTNAFFSDTTAMGSGGQMRIGLRGIISIFGSTVVTGLAACSTHPLPDDISRETSVSIIRNIRCEARDEFIRQVARLLSRSGSAAVRAANPENIIDRPESIKTHDPVIAGTVAKFTVSAIGYSFKFNITETNNNSASLSFSLPFIASNPPADRGNFGLGLSGGIHQKRDANREITMVESFLELAHLDCTKASEPPANLLYPITGTIGMNEVIATFLQLGTSGAGVSKPGQTALNIEHPGEPQFTDTLTFTTDIGVGATPKIVLGPVGQAFQLTEASADLSAGRRDFHELVVTLKFPEMQGIGGALFARTGTERENIVEATKRRAAEELCVQRALALEDEGIVRASAPERYCEQVYRGSR